jgi:hypothetical protein
MDSKIELERRKNALRNEITFHHQALGNQIDKYRGQINLIENTSEILTGKKLSRLLSREVIIGGLSGMAIGLFVHWYIKRSSGTDTESKPEPPFGDQASWFEKIKNAYLHLNTLFNSHSGNSEGEI